MKADEVILAVQPEKGRKSRHRPRVLGFELGESIEIGLRRWPVEDLGRQRLERSQRPLAAAQ